MRKVVILLTLIVLTYFIVWVLVPFGPPEVEGLCTSDHWCWQNPSPHGYNFSCIRFVDEHNGLIVGFNGTVFRTSDGGETWVKTKPPVEGLEIFSENCPGCGWWYYDCWDLRKIQFINHNVGWAVGSNGVILKTTDSGNTWVVQLSPERRLDTPDFISVFFIDEHVGWAVGRQRTPVGKARILKHTIDGGETWSATFPGPPAAIESLNDIFFFNNQLGWAVGDNGVIIHTSDGGNNWQKQPSGPDNRLSAITFTDGQNGWIVGGGVILHTLDGGNLWQIQAEGDWTLSSVAFRDGQTGLAVGSSGTILLTINAGDNWVPVGAENAPAPDERGEPFLRNVIFVNQVAWAVGNKGALLRSEDSGIHWTYLGSQGNRHYLKQVSFTDANIGWILSNYSILRTTDGGMHWVEQVPLPDSACDENPLLVGMSFVDSDYGWVAYWCLREGFRLGSLLYTTDGGQTWSEQYSSTDPNSSFETVFFVNRDRGWLAEETRDGETVIMYTTDGGATWSEQYRGSYMGRYPNDMMHFYFVNGENGWLILRFFRNRILHTTNGGTTWYEEQIPELSNIDAASFVNPNEGWAFGTESETGYGGVLVHTNDGGQHWQKMDYETKWNPNTLPECMGAFASLTSMTFIDESHGWVCGYNGEIFYTVDGGSTWIHQETGTHAILWSIEFVNSDSGWAVGSDGEILHYKQED